MITIDPKTFKWYQARIPGIQGAIEAALFAAEEPLHVRRLKMLVDHYLGIDEMPGVPYEVIGEALEFVRARHEAEGSAMMLVEVDSGFQLRTRPAYSQVGLALRASRPVRLSRAAVETLAIVAYKQPLTRADVEALRGVSSAGTLSTLLDRGLVSVVGKKDEPGRPMVYGTTDYFLSFFGLSSVAELPSLRAFTELSEAHVVAHGDDEPQDVET